MTKMTNSTLNGIILLLVLGLTVGCASTGKGKHGAHVRAMKTTIMDMGDNDGPPTERPDLGVPKSLSEGEGAAEFGVCDRIHFDYDKSEIKAEWEKCLNNNAKYIKQKTQYLLLIEGHCDERGTEEYNIALGERRAQTIAQFLIERGVNPERIVTKTWGESKPLATGHSEDSWRLNRRAEFFIVEQSR
jgi:peptidoglycan-associated lipoprotein